MTVMSKVAPAEPAGSVHRNIPDARGTDLFAADPDLARLLAVYLDADVLARVLPEFRAMGALAGGPLEELALAADKNPPKLHLRTRDGRDEERIEKHPAYVELERVAFERFGLAAMSHRAGVFGAPGPLPPLVKYGLTFLMVQAEFGLCCPLSMTDSLTRTLRRFGDPDLVARHLPALTSQSLETLAQGAMFMTEQIAGSDVGAVETEARRDGERWRLSGDKWFCSNPDAALAMVLARPEGGAPGTRGLSLFLVPRRRADGTPNWRILRLKDKLGTRSMASGEVRLDGAEAWLVGDAGQGFKQMTDMINMSRLSNGLRAAGLMRRAVNESLFIARNRSAFGRRLIDLPLMRRQIAKMLVTAEQGRAMCFHTAHVLERADAGDAAMAKCLRILTPLLKFRTCRDARKVTGDGMEARGGCGYIEEWSDARALRDAHLGSIWEGTSNIVALDVARATRREGELDALSAHLGALLAEVPEPDALAEAWARAAALLSAVAADPAREGETRRAASAVYDAASATILAWQGARLAETGAGGDRRAFADAALRHKLTPRDPLADGEGDETDRLIAAAD
jgi:acyl-CoA dehydrogenase